MSSVKAFDLEKGRQFAKQTKSKFFFASNAGDAYARTFRDSPKIVFPGISSWDEKYLQFTSNLAYQLNDKLKVDIRDDGFFGSSAVSSNFMELNTVAGQLSKPIGFTLIDNQVIRDESNLAKGFVTNRHKKIFQEMMKCKYSDYDHDAKAKISRLSSSGFPLFTYDVGEKHQHLKFLADNITSILDNFNSGNLDINFSKYGLLCASNLSLRNQCDSFLLKNDRYIPKPRIVNDYAFASTGGREGSRFETDKRVYINGIHYSEKATNRTRIVNALPSAYNNIGSVVIEGLRSSAESKYEKTWKHKGKEHVKEKIQGYEYSIGLDVTQYDNSFPQWLFEAWLQELPINDSFRKFCQLGMKAPSFYSANGSEHDPIWTGNPLDLEYYEQYSGLPSGIFYTSMLGKDGFTWAVLCMLDDIHSDVIGNIDSILKHKHDKYAISNMGDDTIVHCQSIETIDKLRYRAKYNSYGMSEYFAVDIEDGFKFLGMVGYRDGESNEVNLVGDLGTYFVNMLVPERSLGSKMRKYGIYGLLERREVYQDNPSFGIADEIFQKEFMNSFGLNWVDLLNDNIIVPSVENITVRSPADLEVLLDPSKLYYKFDQNDISNEILEVMEQSIPLDISKKIREATLKI